MLVGTLEVLSAAPMDEVLFFIVGSWEERGHVYPSVSGKRDMAFHALPEFKSSFVQVLNVWEAITVLQDLFSALGYN